MRVNVYVDGFNLYFRAVKGTPCKWLDINKLCGLLLPGHTINRIKYFTANVSARPDDPDQPIRQQTYLRALRTLPNLSIIYGHFLTNDYRMLLSGRNPKDPASYVTVVKTEEKGSDVNLATHLLSDGYKKDYEMAAVMSKDSDLLEPIRIVRRELKLPVGLLSPGKRLSQALLPPEVDFVKPIRRGVLMASQFPDELTDANGTFRKPASW
jgi:hypothetical protein